MPSLQLTDAAVKRLSIPSQGRTEYWDTKVSGLGIRIASSGLRSWVMILRILKDEHWKQQRLTLGRYPGMSLAAARTKAIEAKGIAEQGENPGAYLQARKIAKLDESRNTFSTVRDEFLIKYRGRQNRKPAPRTMSEIKRVLSSNLFDDWKDRPLTKITRRDVQDILDILLERGSEVMANRTLSYLSMLFGWCVDREIIEASPTSNLKKPGTEQSRERALTEEEIRAIWKATEPTQANHGDMFTGIVRILMLTGQRREEVGGMKWSELDLDDQIWSLPSSRTKNKRPHLVPLSSPVIKIISARKAEQTAIGIDTDFVFTSGISRSGHNPRSFSGWSKSKSRLDKRANIAKWTLHDLRRTFATLMAEDLRIPPHIIESTINHVSGVRAGVAGIYNRALYLDERKNALNVWANHILQLVGESNTDNLLRLHNEG